MVYFFTILGGCQKLYVLQSKKSVYMSIMFVGK